MSWSDGKFDRFFFRYGVHISFNAIKLPSDQDISGRTFGAEEIAAVTEVLQSGILITTKANTANCWKKVLQNASVSNTRTPAIPARPPFMLLSLPSTLIRANEIVTTSITDMGALTPIIFQGAIRYLPTSTRKP